MQRKRSGRSGGFNQAKPLGISYINHSVNLLHDEVDNLYEAFFTECGEPISPNQSEDALFLLERLARFIDDLKEDL